MRAKAPLEYSEQCHVVAWCRARGWRCHHSPNGVRVKSHAARAKLKASGVSAGFPDLLVITPKGLVFIEMKRSNGRPSDVSDEQKEWLLDLQSAGFEAIVSYGAKQAIEFLKRFE